MCTNVLNRLNMSLITTISYKYFQSQVFHPIFLCELYCYCHLISLYPVQSRTYCSYATQYPPPTFLLFFLLLFFRAPVTTILLSISFSDITFYIHVCELAHLMRCTHRGQRTAFRSQFFPSIPETNLMQSCFAVSAFTH